MVFAKTIALLAVLVPAILVDAKKSSTRYQQLRRRRLGKKMGDGNVDRDGLSETSQCVPFDNPKVQLAAKGLVRNGKKGSNDGDGDGANSCSTNTCGGGCCRFYTGFLVCDTSNTFPHLPCVCNDRTGGDGGGVVFPPPDDQNPDIDVSPSEPYEGTDGVEDIDGGLFIDTDPDGPGACAEGSPFQFLSDFEPCFAASDCEGILIDGQSTCCKKGMCFCEPVDTSAQDECVPSA